jgi:hypothetical protein
MVGAAAHHKPCEVRNALKRSNFVGSLQSIAITIEPHEACFPGTCDIGGLIIRLGRISRQVFSAICFSTGVVNLLPVDMINEHEGTRLPGLSRLCGGGKARDVMPGVESVPQLLTVYGGGEEVTSGAEVLGDRTRGGEEPLGLP